MLDRLIPFADMAARAVSVTAIIALVGAAVWVSSHSQAQSDAEAESQGEGANTVFGDWGVRCESRETSPPCDMVQVATQNDTGDLVMQFSIAHAGYREAYGIQFVVPLNVLITAGVTLRIDEGPVLPGYGFTRCDQGGCFVERLIDNGELEVFRAGETGLLRVVRHTGVPLTIPLSFTGFSEALNTMTARNRAWANSL